MTEGPAGFVMIGDDDAGACVGGICAVPTSPAHAAHAERTGNPGSAGRAGDQVDQGS